MLARSAAATMREWKTHLSNTFQEFHLGAAVQASQDFRNESPAWSRFELLTLQVSHSAIGFRFQSRERKYLEYDTVPSCADGVPLMRDWYQERVIRLSVQTFKCVISFTHTSQWLSYVAHPENCSAGNGENDGTSQQGTRMLRTNIP